MSDLKKAFVHLIIAAVILLIGTLLHWPDFLRGILWGLLAGEAIETGKKWWEENK